MNNNLKIIGMAYGNPFSEKVFSGVSKYLFNIFEMKELVAGYVSSKQIRPWDAFSGMLDFSKIKDYGKPGVNPVWIWKKNTVEKLSRRVEDKISAIKGFNTVLQIGTQVWINMPDVKHYCFTDMTITQAKRADQFSVKKLGDGSLTEAIAVQKSIFENCSGIFVASNWTKESVVEEYDIPCEKVHVVGLGASVPGEMTSQRKIYDKKIIFIGRNWKRKGGPILVEAFKKVKDSIPDLKLTIIGCNPEIDLPDVKVYGNLNKEQYDEFEIIKSEFLDASVMCVPSMFEPFGICFLEAQLCGIPPVTFAGEGRNDAILDNTTGLIVQEKSADALADALLSILQDTEKAKTMGQAGKNFIKDSYTWEKVAERMLDVISKD